MPLFNDDYNVDEQWHKMRKLIEEIQPDVYKFLGKNKNKSASIRVRNNLNELRKLCISLRESVLFQRQDNDSDYS